MKDISSFGLTYKKLQDNDLVYVKEDPVVEIKEIIREKYETKIICERIKKRIITDNIQIGGKAYFKKFFYIDESPNGYEADTDMIIVRTGQDEDLRGSKQVVFV